MGFLNDVIEEGDTRQLGSTGFSFIDADTLQKGNKKYRLMGYDAPEVKKIIAGKYVRGTAGGEQATQSIYELANQFGFTNIKPQLDENGNEVLDTTGSRTMADLYNDKGESFKTMLLKEGLFDPTKRFSTLSDRSVAGVGRIERERDALLNIEQTGDDADWDKAASLIEQARFNEGEKRLGLKATAPDEASLAAIKSLGYGDYFLSGAVQNRRTDRNLNNESLNPLSDSWEQGWLSVLESSYGFLNMAGETLGSEYLAEMGEEGVQRAKDKINSYGTTLTDYRDVDGIMDAISFISNNMALSLPYMAVTAGGIMVGNLATPGIAALGLGAKGFQAARYGAQTLAPSSVYSGMTWNEMEGEKSAAIAFGSGIAQATLDRLGIFGISRIGKAPKKLFNEASEQLTNLQKTIKLGKTKNGTYKKNKLGKASKEAEDIFNRLAGSTLGARFGLSAGKELTKEQAEQVVASASRREIADMFKDGARIAKEQYAGKRVLMDIVKNSGRAGLSEGITELGQEVTGYMSAVIGSDKVFDMNELKHRAVTAAIVGTAVGGPLGAPGTVYNAAAWHNVDRLIGNAELNEASESYQFAEQESDLKTNLQNAKDTRKQIQRQETILKNQIDSLKKERRKLNLVIIKEARKDKSNSSYLKGLKALDEKINSLENQPKDKFNQRALEEEAKQKDENIEDRVLNALKKFPNLFKGATAAIFDKTLMRDSAIARKMGSQFGAFLQKINPGSTYESSKVINRSALRNLVIDPDTYYTNVNLGKNTRANRRLASERMYNLWSLSLDKNGNFNKSKAKLQAQSLNMTKLENEAHIELIENLQDLSREGLAQARANGLNLRELKNYFSKYRSLSVKAVAKNRPKFEAALMSEYKISQNEAKEITDRILSNNITNMDEAFTVAKGELTPGFAHERTMKLSEKESMKEFLEQDVFANVASYTHSLSRHVAHHQFVGKDGEVLSWELDKMEQELTPKYGAEKARQLTNKVALGMKNYLDAESGNYKRATSDAGKKLESVQRSFMLFTTLAGLPLATISSFVELALTGRSLTASQLNGLFKAQGKELANTLYRGMIDIANKAPTADISVSDKLSDAQLELRRLGYHEYDVGAATTVGATEINAWQQDIMKSFFKWNGLQGWTNYTRAVRASIAVDFINDKLKIIHTYNMQNASGKLPVTREVQLARESLRNLGMDVDFMVDLFDRFENAGSDQSVNQVFKFNPKMPDAQLVTKEGELDIGIMSQEEAKLRNENINEATFNFINEAVALPMSANRPLIYQDPRFAIFTQFQGFMATFTANHIPRMWGEYVKRGSPEMKYSAFATMATMILLGFTSQALKDMIKYEEGENEYLDTPRYIRRGITSSGLLGTYERILDQFFPMYTTTAPKDEAGGRWMLRTIASESPAASNLKRLVDGFGNILEGDVGSGVRKIGKSTPFIGSVNRATNQMGETASRFDFDNDE